MGPKSRALTHSQGVLGVLPSNKPSPPCMFSVFDRSCCTTKGWKGVLGVCCGLLSRHCWVLHPMTSRGVPNHHFPGTRFSHLLLAPNWLYAKRSMPSCEYIALGPNLLATSVCRTHLLSCTQPLPITWTGKGGCSSSSQLSGSLVGQSTAASHASAPQEEHQSEERGFPVAL